MRMDRNADEALAGQSWLLLCFTKSPLRKLYKTDAICTRPLQKETLLYARGLAVCTASAVRRPCQMALRPLVQPLLEKDEEV